MPERVAIVGIGETEHRSTRPDVTHEELINQAVRRALEDAQLTIRDIDTVVTGNMDLFEGHYLADTMYVDSAGMFLKPGFKVNTGGTVGASTVAAGWHHIASGLFETALVIGWQKQDAAPSISALITAREPLYDRWLSAGATGIMAAMGLTYLTNNPGCKEEHAALSRVIMSENAARNPYAHLRHVLTVEEVMQSREIVWPCRLLHMSPTSCGAVAMVLASEGRAKKITKKPIWITDVEVRHREAAIFRGGCVEAIPDKMAIEVASINLYKRNGITNPAKEIDVWELYIPSSWALFPFMEWHHVCEEGEAWKLVEKEAIRIEGDIPIDPSGGVVCTNAIGNSGTMRVAEAALQIRGDAGEHQVTKKVEKAVAAGWGSCHWSVMLLLSKSL